MKQISINAKTEAEQLTIGLDLGDKFCFYCVLDEAGEVDQKAKVPITAEKLRRVFSRFAASVVALEAGTHSR
jgi:hypothetical protein